MLIMAQALLQTAQTAPDPFEQRKEETDTPPQGGTTGWSGKSMAASTRG
jgi:hypothetical protein